jgi:DNA-binding transcriptional regulator YdaS (Cro superfamily)
MVEQLTRYEALLRCREKAGDDSKLARDLGVTQPRVWRWINQSKQLPAEHVLDAERLYGVSRHALRPDIYPRNYPPAPDDELRWIGVDMAAPGYDRSAHVTVPATHGAR